MRLYLLRHAKAEQHSPSGRDDDRPLSARGRAQAAALQRELAEGKLPAPAVTVSSPAQRALDTAHLVLSAINGASIDTDPRIWNATVSDLLDVLGDHLDDPSPLMLVGHNPGFEQLTRWLTASLPVPGVKTCTLVDLQLDDAPAPGVARLLGLHRPAT